MPSKKTEAAHDHSALEAEIAALKKEIQTLKAELRKAPKGGVDPRVDAIAEYLKLRKSSEPNKSEKLKKLLSSF